MPPTVFDQSGNTKVNSPIGHVRFSTLGFVRIFFAFSLVRCVVYFYFDWPPWLPWFQLHDRLDYQPLFGKGEIETQWESTLSKEEIT